MKLNKSSRHGKSFGSLLLLSSMVSLGIAAGCAPSSTTSADSDSAVSGDTYQSTASLGEDPRQNKSTVLVYNGDGSASADTQSLTSILSDHKIKYELFDSAELDALSLEGMANFGLILWPGGYAGTASKSLNPETRIRIQKAVTERGVSYIGFCAGSFIAMNPPGVAEKAPDYGFSIVPYGSILPEYEPNGIHQDQKPMTLSFSLFDGTKRDFVWYGGPYFPNAKEVLARYTTGDPAIIQTAAGKGFAIFTGPHPESPPSWVSSDDKDGVNGDIEFAWQLISAALERRPLPTL